MDRGRKFVLVSAISLALMVTAWSAYFLGYTQRTKLDKSATDSAQPIATGSGDFTLAAQDDLFNQQNADGSGVATGSIKSLTTDTISLGNARGDQTAVFKVDSDTIYVTVKDKKLTQEGIFTDLKLGLLIQISFKSSGTQRLAQLVIR